MRECSPNCAPSDIVGGLGLIQFVALTRRHDPAIASRDAILREPVNVVRGTPSCEARPLSTTGGWGSRTKSRAFARWGRCCERLLPGETLRYQGRGLGQERTSVPWKRRKSPPEAVASRISRLQRRH